MFAPRVRHIRVLLLKAAKDAAPPARCSMRVCVAHAEYSVCCLRRIVSGRRFLFGLLVGLCPFCRLLIGVLCSLARNFIPFTSLVVADAIRILFSSRFPPSPKGCSMGAKRVIKGCSARDHPNVIPICKQRRHLCRRSPFFYFKSI